MAWVREEYAGELAVLAAWVSALLPWSASVAAERGITFVVVRFPYFMFQFIYGADFGPAEKPFLTVNRAPAFPEAPVIVRAYWVWAAAAAVFTLALVLSVAYYLREERVESFSLDPVRLMGGLLGVTGLLLAASTVLLWQGFPGMTVPIGSVLVLVFAGVLLRIERT